ncbi:MAG: hypothetical protein AB7P31_02995 [Steroidobacteraceae bacterium]
MNKLLHHVRRGLSLLAGLGLLLALAEGAASLAGRSLVGHAYSAGRLLELATMLMVFAIGLQLRSLITLR